MVTTTPGGYWDSIMSRARMRAWQKGVVRRLSGGELKVRR